MGISGAFAFLVEAANAVDALTGGRLMGIVLAFIASILFITLVGIVIYQLVKR